MTQARTLTSLLGLSDICVLSWTVASAVDSTLLFSPCLAGPVEGRKGNDYSALVSRGPVGESYLPVLSASLLLLLDRCRYVHGNLSTGEDLLPVGSRSLHVCLQLACCNGCKATARRGYIHCSGLQLFQLVVLCTAKWVSTQRQPRLPFTIH